MSANGGSTSTVYCSEPGDGYIAAHTEGFGALLGRSGAVSPALSK